VIYAVVGCRCLIGTVFLVSAVSKARSATAFRGFANWLAGLTPLPLRGPRVAAAVVLAEAAIAVSVGLPWTVRPGLTFATVVLGALAIGVFLVVRSGLSTSCQCFGESGAPMGLMHVIRNVVLCAVAAAGVITAALAGNASPRPAGAALAGGVAAAAALCTFYLEDLVTLFAVPGPGQARGDGSRQEREA
jgi:multisubunit Na+/H+ antiporter MnhB subunit